MKEIRKQASAHSTNTPPVTHLSATPAGHLPLVVTMGSTNWKTRAVPVGRVLFSCPMPLMALCIAAANLDVGCSGPPSSVTFMVHDVLGHIRSEVPLGSIYLPSSFHLILSSCEMVPCVSLCVCVLNCNNNKQQTTNNKQQQTTNNKQ